MDYERDGLDQEEKKASWQRCVTAGVEPEGGRNFRLAPEALAERRAKSGSLLTEVREVWDVLAAGARAPGPAAWLVADAEGYLLDCWITGDFRGGDSLPLAPGDCWREEYLGTNGLGTSLVLGHPMLICGGEHYCRFLRPWCSLGVPVRAPEKSQELSGVVALLFPLQFREVAGLYQGMVLAWAQAVVKGLKLRSRLDLMRTNDLILQTTANGVITVDQEQLEAMVITDQVTRLYNHRFFQQRLEEELERAERHHTSASLLRIDIDSFRAFNELFGLAAGDALLAQVGQTLRSLVRPLDVVARLNTDEFAMLLVDTQASEAMEVAENIRQAVSVLRPAKSRGESNGQEWTVTVSVGVATYPVNSTEAASLFRQAGAAMNQAKDTGGNKVELYFKLLDDIYPVVKGSPLETFNTIKTLITVINAKDRYTYGHTERVERYADWLGRQMHLSAEELSWLRYGAFLHDIGKIEVSRDLLNKKGPLAASEWDVLKKHPVWGAEIVRSVNLLVPAAPIVLYHHERYDGHGYPAGLARDSIPWLARILAVVDSFDAMTTTRPYKKARNLGEAITELQACAGSQFDPAVVEQFCWVLEEMQPEGLLYLEGGV